ncbi:MAG: RsmD family RNA methyltransferase [Pirellulales bacterium]
MSARRRSARTRRQPHPLPASLRIIGGTYGGRKLLYAGDPRTRPMKQRVREAIFNLISTDAKGKHALDLFAGTGALGLEAVSRGAARATFIERHFPTAEVIRRNVATVGAAEVCEVVAADTFLWCRQHVEKLRDGPPVVAFCSPPYDFYVDRLEEMLRLIESVYAACPSGSVVVVESDARFDPGRLPPADRTDSRRYPPAVVTVMRKDEGVTR